jgi:uncharacterized protein YutE (UPF0331/DUF86 family)
MVQATGFRNLLVHQYAKLDLSLVYQVVRKDIHDLKSYLRLLFINLKI